MNTRTFLTESLGPNPFPLPVLPSPLLPSPPQTATGRSNPRLVARMGADEVCLALDQISPWWALLRLALACVGMLALPSSPGVSEIGRWMVANTHRKARLADTQSA